MFRNSRRQFLSQGALLAGAIASGSIDLATGHLPMATAIEPIRRAAPAQWKYSLAAYSYRDLFGKSATSPSTPPDKTAAIDPAFTLYDFVDDCARLGCHGTELTSYYFSPTVTAAELQNLRRHCFRQGLEVSGTAVGNDFGKADKTARDAEIASVKTWIDRAALLGAPVIRIFAGNLPGGTDHTAGIAQIVSCIEECCDYAGRHGIHLALENHGGPTATAEGLLEIVRRVNSPWFGVNLDTGNFHSENLYDELARCAPYALNVQVKVATSGPDGKKTPTDYPRLGKILRDAGYRGYVVLEYEEGGDPRAACQEHFAAMRKGMEA
ncbi:MAG: sugar phosphate isomerase/epimerase family protein [Pirellulales bacterium]|nr:sugar phosphate isomerase/epimerase family protein [Pirellulales bacterium]